MLNENILIFIIKNNEFTSVFSPNSISESISNYVDFLNSLAVKFDANMIIDVDEFINTAKSP